MKNQNLVMNHESQPIKSNPDKLSKLCKAFLKENSNIELQSLTKYMEQNRKVQQSWTGQEKFDIHSLKLFCNS